MAKIKTSRPLLSLEDPWSQFSLRSRLDYHHEGHRQSAPRRRLHYSRSPNAYWQRRRLPLLRTRRVCRRTTVETDCLQCQLLRDAGVPNVILPSNSTYQVDVESYWSVTAQLHPNCFVQPENAQQVSLIIKTLVNKSKCQFAVRSGGHSAIAGWNNIDNGVTIDLCKYVFIRAAE